MNKSFSLWRELEYGILSQLTLNGTVLDLWGSKKSWYHKLIQWKHDFTVVNISEEYGYDINFDIQERFPLEDASYDHVIAINVLEHIYKHQNVLNESHRVIKKWGKLIMVTPFMFNVHGSPDDYFRYTRSALQKILIEAGFDSESIEIHEIWSGVFSVFYQMISGMIPTYPLRTIIKKIFVWIDRLLSRISKKYKVLMSAYPLGYITTVTK